MADHAHAFERAVRRSGPYSSPDIRELVYEAAVGCSGCELAFVQRLRVRPEIRYASHLGEHRFDEIMFEHAELLLERAIRDDGPGRDG